MFSYIFVYQTYTNLYDTLSSVLPFTAVGRDGSEAESNARGKKTYQQITPLAAEDPKQLLPGHRGTGAPRRGTCPQACCLGSD